MPGTDYQTLTPHIHLMPRIDYQTLSNIYQFHAGNRLSDTKQHILISCLD